MKRQKKSQKRLRSFNEYKKTFFPESFRRARLEALDPREAGRIMAEEAFHKLSPILDAVH